MNFLVDIWSVFFLTAQQRREWWIVASRWPTVDTKMHRSNGDKKCSLMT